MKFLISNIISPIILGVLASLVASFFFLRILLRAKPKVKIYPSFIITRDDPHFFIVISTDEKEIIDLGINAILAKKVQKKEFTIPIPLWHNGHYPYFATPKFYMPVKLNKNFFEGIIRQQGSYKSISDSLINQLKSFVENLDSKEKYDNFNKAQRNKANILFRQLIKEYGSVYVIVNILHKKTGLPKIITRSIYEIQDIKDLNEIEKKRYSDIH